MSTMLTLKTFQRIRRWLAALTLAAALLSLAALTVVTAQSGGYTIDWFTIDSGGAVIPSQSGYALSGTIGQPDAGSPILSGGYALSGGFWPNSPTTNKGYSIYLPVCVRGGK